MFREGLQSGEGMLFIFESPAPHAFWMKNMAFPIDVIWADEGQRVVHIVSDLPPCQQDPCPVARPPAPSKYVLEVAAKESEKIGLRLGDVLDLRQIR